MKSPLIFLEVILPDPVVTLIEPDSSDSILTEFSPKMLAKSISRIHDKTNSKEHHNIVM